MPALHPALLELRTEIERQGSVVVCHGDYICVRLPLFASIRIRLNGSQLHFEPRFGPLSRGTSLVLTPVVAALAVIAVSAAAPLATTIAAACAGALTGLYDLQRLVMTEGAMTRLQLLWSTRQPPQEVIGAPTGAPAIAVSSRPAALPAALDPEHPRALSPRTPETAAHAVTPSAPRA